VPRVLTSTQQTNVDAAATRPVYVVAWEHSGVEELLSCAGDIILDSKVYTAGGLNVGGIQDGRSATITLPATSTRIAEIQNNAWRGGTCKIYAVPASPSDSGIYIAAESILMMNGVITASRFRGETISVNIIHVNLDGDYSPRDLLDDVCNHIPAPGTQILWEGDRMTLETRR